MRILSLCKKQITDEIFRCYDSNIKVVQNNFLESISLKKEEYIHINNECNIVVLDFITLSNTIVSKGKSFDESSIKDICEELIELIMNTILRYYNYNQIFFLNLKDYITNNDSGLEAIIEKKILFTVKKIPLFNIIEVNLTKKLGNEFSNTDALKYDEATQKIFKIIRENKGEKVYKNEKYYTCIKNIRYIFEKAKMFNKDKLLIIFSSFSADAAKYNYINTLKFTDCNKLFILDDYGTKGSYYIGLDGQFDIETSVVSLITNIISENNISFNNIISVGSSKGGSAALYYGLKYNFGHVVAGAPQYKIGTYLIDLSIKDYAIEIFGGLEPAKRIKYDNLIRKVAKKGQKTNISILTGDGDPQYKRILKDFETLSEELELNLKVEKCDIENHNDISKVFPRYLLSNVEEILQGKGCIKGNVLLNILNKFN